MISKSRHDISNKAFMSPIIWNSSGFYVVDRFPNDTKMKSHCVVITLLIRVEQAIFPRKRASHQKQLVAHPDNCPVHLTRASTDWLEEQGMCGMPHPPYSPDLTSSNFDLFPTVKKTWIDSGGWREPVFQCLQDILRHIDQNELNAVSQAWLRRVQEANQGNRD
jgi:hypothetical protein